MECIEAQFVPDDRENDQCRGYACHQAEGVNYSVAFVKQKTATCHGEITAQHHKLVGVVIRVLLPEKTFDEKTKAIENISSFGSPYASIVYRFNEKFAKVAFDLFGQVSRS